MNETRSIPMRVATGKRLWTLLGFAAVTMAVASASSAIAAPGDESKDRSGPHQGKGPPPGASKGGLREQFGGGKPDGKPGDEGKKLGHDHKGAAGAPGAYGHHGVGPEVLKKRLEELSKKEAAGTLTDADKKELERLKQFHQRRLTREERKARLNELREKESAGKLTPDEKAELGKVQEIQARHEALEQAAKAREENRKQRVRDAKRHALKEFPKLTQDAAATAEYRKHAERLAKLERAKELASADKNSDVVTRIEALLSREKQRHQAWLTKHQPAAQGANQGANQ